MTEPAISHPPQAGKRPRAAPAEEHSVPKAATKLAEAPSTPPASNSKAPLALPNSSGPPTEASSSTVTVPDYGGSERPKGETSTVIRSTSLLKRQDLEFGKLDSKAKSLIFRNTPPEPPCCESTLKRRHSATRNTTIAD